MAEKEKDPGLRVTRFHGNLSQEVFVFSHPQTGLECTMSSLWERATVIVIVFFV